MGRLDHIGLGSRRRRRRRRRRHLRYVPPRILYVI